MVTKYHFFILEIDIKQVECKDRNGEVTNKAIAHQKRELHEPGEICVSVSRQFHIPNEYIFEPSSLTTPLLFSIPDKKCKG